MRDLRELKMNEGHRPILAGPLVHRAAPTAEQIDAFERHFGIRLPSDYVAFLAFCNGGHPQLSAFRPPGRAADWEVTFFYFLGEKRDEPYGIWRAAVAWQEAGHKNSIPIARDPFGNKILLCFDTVQPCVRLSIQDDGEDEMCKLADSFPEFLDMLFFDPESVVE